MKIKKIILFSLIFCCTSQVSSMDRFRILAKFNQSSVRPEIKAAATGIAIFSYLILIHPHIKDKTQKTNLARPRRNK